MKENHSVEDDHIGDRQKGFGDTFVVKLFPLVSTGGFGSEIEC
jgi:hypothetical protein